MKEQADQTKTNPSNRRSTRILRTPAVIVFIGLVFGVLYDQVENTGLLADWSQLTLPSTSEVELITVDFLDAFVEDQDGLIWECSARRLFCKTAENLPVRQEELRQPCDYSLPAFSIISTPPEDIQQCVQSFIGYADAEGYSVAVIDKEGNLWHWENLRGGFLGEEVLFIYHLCSATFLSVLLWVLFYIGSWLTRALHKLRTRIVGGNQPINS